MISMGLAASLVAILVGAALLMLKFTGHNLRIQSISIFPPALHGISYNHSWKRSNPTSWSIDAVDITLHIPGPWNPRFATVKARGVGYVKEGECVVTIETTTLTFWFLPVFFHFTGGNIITLTVETFVVDIASSRGEPWWVKAIRRNIIETMLKGETIRLHDLKTKVWLYQPNLPAAKVCELDDPRSDTTEFQKETYIGRERHRMEGSLVEGFGVDGSSEAQDALDAEDQDESSGQDSENTEDSEARARIQASNWLIHNHRNKRMYKFGAVNALLQRPWGGTPPVAGSFILRAIDSGWLKLSDTHTKDGYFTRNASTQLLLSIIVFPRYVGRIFKDPLSLVDIEVTEVQLTFRNFRVRDAELFVHGLEAAKSKYNRMEPSAKSAIFDWGWDIFCDGVQRAFR